MNYLDDSLWNCRYSSWKYTIVVYIKIIIFINKQRSYLDYTVYALWVHEDPYFVSEDPYF